VVKSRTDLATFLDLLKKIKIFMENKIKIIEDLGDEGWVNDLSYFAGVIGHFSILHKELQGKYKLIKEVFDSIRLSKLSFDCWKISHGASPH
jgi:hypothetical protein